MIRPIIQPIFRSIYRSITGAFKILFNGTTQYGTMLPWVPTSILSSYTVEFTVDTAATGLSQWVVRGDTVAGAHGLFFTAAGTLRFQFRDSGGVLRNIDLVAAVDGTRYDTDVEYKADRVRVRINTGAWIESLNPPEILKAEFLAAANGIPAEEFGGTIHNTSYTDQAGIQNGDYVEGNGTDINVSLSVPVGAGDVVTFDYRPVSTGVEQILLSDSIAFVDFLKHTATDTLDWGGSAVANVILDGVLASKNVSPLVAGQVYVLSFEAAVPLLITSVLSRHDDLKYVSGIISNLNVNAGDYIYTLANKNNVVGVIDNGDGSAIAVQSGSVARAVDVDLSGESWSAAGDGVLDTQSTDRKTVTWTQVTVDANNGIRVADSQPALETGKLYKYSVVSDDNVVLAVYDNAYALVAQGGIGETIYFVAPDTPRIYIGVAEAGSFSATILIEEVTDGIVNNYAGMTAVAQNSRNFPMNEGSGDIAHDSLNSHRMKYHFDGVDDYMTIPQADLVSGDTVSFKFVAPTAILSTGEALLGGTRDAGVNAVFIVQTNGGLWNYDTTAFSSLTVDGSVITAGVTAYSLDGLEHEVVATVAVDVALFNIGANSTNVQLVSRPIYNIDINAVSGNRYYAVNDGTGSNVVDSESGEDGTIINPDSTHWIDSSPTDITLINSPTWEAG